MPLPEEDKFVEELVKLLNIAKDIFNKENLQKVIINVAELDKLLSGFSKSIEIAVRRLVGGNKSKKYRFFQSTIFGNDKEILELLTIEAEFLILHFENLKKDLTESKPRPSRRVDGFLHLLTRDEQVPSRMELYFVGASTSDNINFGEVVWGNRQKISSAAEALSIFFDSLAQFDKVKMLFHTIKEFTDLIKIFTQR